MEGGYEAAGLGILFCPSAPILICPRGGGGNETAGEGMASLPLPHHLPRYPEKEPLSSAKTSLNFCSSELFYKTQQIKEKELRDG